jgi:hypothetical protein
MKITKIQIVLLGLLALFVLALPGQVFAGKYGGANSKSFLARQAKLVTPPTKPVTPPVKREKPIPPKRPVTPPVKAGQLN